MGKDDELDTRIIRTVAFRKKFTGMMIWPVKRCIPRARCFLLLIVTWQQL